MVRVRRAYICGHRDCVPPERRFVGPQDPEPSCPVHGKMKLQANVPYERPDPDSRVVGSGRPVPKPKRRPPKRPARGK